MKGVLVTAFHTVIWMSFVIVLSLSQRDRLYAKIALFLMFLYFCYVVAHYILQRRKAAVIFTLRNSTLFLLIQQMVSFFYRL